MEVEVEATPLSSSQAGQFLIIYRPFQHRELTIHENETKKARRSSPVTPGTTRLAYVSLYVSLTIGVRLPKVRLKSRYLQPKLPQKSSWLFRFPAKSLNARKRGNDRL